MNETKAQLLRPQKQIHVTPYDAVMNEQFVTAYREALKFSNLQLDTELTYRNVVIYGHQHMHQVLTISQQELPHIVLLHGFGGTSLTYIRLFQRIRHKYQVHALDTFGIGLSSLGAYNQQMNTEEAINYYIDAIEEWRKAIGINYFTLVGHSFGGYIASLYVQKHSSHVNVQRLILLSPAGSSTHDQEYYDRRVQQAPFSRKCFYCFAEKVYNLHVRPSKLLTLWLFGQRILERILTQRLKLQGQEKQAWKRYLRPVARIEHSSETGFYKLLNWPLRGDKSIETIIKEGNYKFKIEFYFGDEDWMDRQGPKRLSSQMKTVTCEIIKNSGHQLIFDNPTAVAERILAND